MAAWEYPGGKGSLASQTVHEDGALATTPVGLVFKPSSAGSLRNPPRKKSWNQNKRLQANGRPISGVSASTYTSVVTDAQGSYTSGMSRASSSPQLRKGTTKLPPLPKQPFSFEEMYSKAKKQANKKSLQGRQNSQLSSPPSTSSSRLGWAMRNREPEHMAAMALDVPPSRAERNWASDILFGQNSVQVDAIDETEFEQPSRQPSRRGSKRRTTRIGEEFSDGVDCSVQESDVGGDHRPSYARRVSTVSCASKASESARKSTKIASEAYIKALRAMMDDGDYTRFDNFCNDIRVAIAGLSGATETRLQVQENGFTQDELQRMDVAFRRFKSPEAAEIHADELPHALSFLGYMKVDKDACNRLSSDITKYSMLDFQEYLDFLEHFAIYEREEFQKEFDNFDGDNSGMLSFEEVKDLITSMGVTPLRDTLLEAFEVVDFNGSGHLDFQEFVHLMTIYRVTEGFTRSEVRDLKLMFDRVAIHAPGEAKRVPAERLGDVLARWFGPQAATLADKLARRFALGEGATTTHLEQQAGARRNSSASVGTNLEDNHELNDTGLHSSLEFSEFLLWARRLREAEIKEFHKQFVATNSSGTGFVDKVELGDMLHELGYMPLSRVIDEILAKVDVDGNGELDFEEFVHLMGIFRKTDGFTADEVAELTSVFRTYEVKDDDYDDGKVDCLKLTDMLRSMGYNVNLDKVRHFITEVDFDNSNTLDLSEFLRLMRMHRESELKRALEVFDEHKEHSRGGGRRKSTLSLAGEAVLPQKKLRKALAEVGYRPNDEDFDAAIAHVEKLFERSLEDLDFDSFVDLIDACRKSLIGFRRRHAGYPEDELKRYFQAFQIYDEDGNGTIEKHELTTLLRDIGIPLRTKEEQEGLLVKLDLARVQAKNAGVKEKQTGPLGSPFVTFHTMLFLLRMMQTESDEDEAALETDMKEATGFAPKEIADFRDIFTYWAIRSAELDVPASPTGGNEKKDNKAKEEKKSSILGGDVQEEMSRNQTISAEGMMRIVRSLGVQMSNRDKHVIEDKLVTIQTQCGDMSPGPKPKYTFFNFLLFMKWTLETNFGNIGEVIQQTDENPFSSEV